MQRSIRSVALILLLHGLPSCVSFHRPVLKIEKAERIPFVVHSVKSGETLGTIAEKYTGKIALWKELVTVNSGIDPKKLRVGDAIKIPAQLLKANLQSKSTAKKPPSAAARNATAQRDRAAEVEILPGNTGPAPERVPVIRDPLAAGVKKSDPASQTAGYDPEPFVPEVKPTIAHSPQKPKIDPHKLEEERLKRRYEVLMEIMNNETGPVPQ
ncbi:MAG: LysM peptidoglycan-binding domain-containing protein [Deltaproteobacteria bacterium]|nr:LysM peptidoglycan-binding domain-containing protein [Deltaproteobacteria bacterium]